MNPLITNNTYISTLHTHGNRKSVPLRLLIRCKRVCSEEKYFEEESKIIIQQLTSRKYPMKLLQEALDKVKKMDRLELLRQSIKKESHKIRLITHYNHSNPNLHQILLDHTGLLLMTRKEAIKPEDIQVTYSRSPNLKDILIKGSLKNTQQPRGSTPCGKPRC